MEVCHHTRKTLRGSCPKCGAKFDEYGNQELEMSPEEMFGPEALVQSRKVTHGDFSRKSVFIQGMKGLMREDAFAHWYDLSQAQQEALDAIAVKIGRILYGSPYCRDHWDDIAGYAHLISRSL